MSNEPLDPFEARIRSYLKARADVPVPPDLLAAARNRAATPDRQSFVSRKHWFGAASISNAAAAAVVVVAVVVGGALLLPRVGPGIGPVSVAPSAPTAAPVHASSATLAPLEPVATQPAPALPTSAPAPVPSAEPAVPSATSSASPSPSESLNPDEVAFPALAQGLPVQNVASAIELIARGAASGREIAVGGYWNMPGSPYPCPPGRDSASGAVPDCLLMYLADSDLHLGVYSSPTDPTSLKEWRAATVPALRPVIDAEAEGTIEAIWHDVPFNSPLRIAARRVVVLGHAGDPRAWACVSTPVSQCAANFVLDRVVWVEGRRVAIAPVPPSYPRKTSPALSPQAAVDVAGAAFSSATVLTVLPIEALLAPTIDPRIRAGVDGFVWIARAITGPADSSGTAPLDEVVISDSTGQVVQRLSVAAGANYQPATVVLSGGRGNGGTYDVELPDGTVILTGSTSNGAVQPAVLEAGDYRVLAWAGGATADNPPPGACTRDIHVHALQHVWLVASFGGPNYDSGPCTWDRVPPRTLP